MRSRKIRLNTHEAELVELALSILQDQARAMAHDPEHCSDCRKEFADDHDTAALLRIKLAAIFDFTHVHERDVASDIGSIIVPEIIPEVDGLGYPTGNDGPWPTPPAWKMAADILKEQQDAGIPDWLRHLVNLHEDHITEQHLGGKRKGKKK